MGDGLLEKVLMTILRVQRDTKDLAEMANLVFRLQLWLFSNLFF